MTMMLCAVLSVSLHAGPRLLATSNVYANPRAHVVALAPVEAAEDRKLAGETVVGIIDRWWSRRRERIEWRRRPERIILVRHGEYRHFIEHLGRIARGAHIDRIARGAELGWWRAPMVWRGREQRDEC